VTSQKSSCVRALSFGSATGLLFGVSLVLQSGSAHAWEKHQSLMPALMQGMTQNPKLAAALSRTMQAPCPEEDQAIYAKLAAELQLNPKAKVLPTSAEACAHKNPITAREILSSFVVDEPDFGMDEDIPGPPESYDPQGDQKWMGGTQGPTSKGFRHMYFGGEQVWHPIATFQVPARAMGLAPARAGLLARKARELIQSANTSSGSTAGNGVGDPAGNAARLAWGYRVLGWAIHYVQDLSQPFHAVQIPSLRMVPWYAALQWPPGPAFEELVHETTRTISNYHWAYEDYVHLRVTEERSPFTECLANPDQHSLLTEDARRDEALRDPMLLALRTAHASVQIAPHIGRANVRFFGATLKQRGVDLPRNQGTPDYAEMALRPDLVDQREELRRVTCIALANAAWSTRALIEWATTP
jgi:hypothetical protein